MPKTLKRRKGDFEAEAAFARLQELAREQTERLGPFADQARETAALRLQQARGWTAPRLEQAANRVEDTVAPRVADLLTIAAHKVEPSRARRGLIAARHGRRRVPRAVVLTGVATLGAVALYGALKLRQASQDAEWQENLDQAREQVRETRENLAAKARGARAKAGRSADAKAEPDAEGPKETAAAGAKGSAADLNGSAAK
ncbi:hypothetical protein ACFOVU_28440 [Nocardiopsis sediminis]|uniref:DUF3618 domain-containing protein n=1 Tax=Nocardiopsis sediminis TaxID=1778267 RepID=A0ABV8FUN0_9ACTN